MTRRSSIALAGVLLLLAGCGAAATPIPSTGAPSAAPSAEASTATASTEPSVEASTAASAEASLAVPSIAIPSITLPSEAKDLEAVLPATLCGSPSTKTSVSGTSFMASADPQFVATLQALGKTPADVAFAIAFSTDTKCSAGIFRIKGADAGKLQSTLLAQEQKSGKTVTQGNVGGKNVYMSTSGSGKEYVYFAGDAVVFASAPDDTTAATVLQALP